MNEREKKKYIKALGKKIQEIRKDQNVSQDQLAFESGLNRIAIVRIEVGRSVPTISSLLKIATALNVDVRDLIPSSGHNN